MNAKVELHFSPQELNLVLVALGRLPYTQVHELIGRIQAAAGPQLLAASERADGEIERLPRDDG